MSELQHIPVLLETVLDVLQPRPDERVLDATLGLGGHAQAFLALIRPRGALVGLDADIDNLRIAEGRLAEYSDRLTLIHTNFGSLSADLGTFDLIFADLGLSSPHLDDPQRGFSFRFDGPLDLRFNRSTGKTAAQIILEAEEDDLAHIFRSFGELFKEARTLSRMLAQSDIPTTTALRSAVEKRFGFRAKHILPQVFQALRIAVNDEMAVLHTLLRVAPGLLHIGGRFGVLSYHSLEDRMVKQAFRALCEPEKDQITGKVSVPASFALRTKKAIQASDEEIARNPRSRSVKFRALERISV